MKKLVIAILVLLSLTSQAQVNCDSIAWTKISWADFKAKPDTISEFGAISWIGIGYKFLGQEGKSQRIKVECYFNQCNSWTKRKSDKNLTLPHEQTHFDISEYCRRLFIKQLLESHFSKANVAASVDKIFQKILKKRETLNEMYDKETDFHRDSAQQLIWTEKINKMVKELSPFNKETIVLLSTKDIIGAGFYTIK